MEMAYKLIVGLIMWTL